MIIFASSDGQSSPHRVSEGQFLSEGRAPYEKFCPTAATVANYPIRARRSQLFLRGAPCEKCCHAATTVASAPQPLFFWGQRAPYEKFCPTAATVAARRILGATRVPHNHFPQQRLRQYTHSSPSQFIHLAASGFFPRHTRLSFT